MELSDVIQHDFFCKHLTDTQTKRLSSIISGETTIHFLVSGSLYSIAHTYVEKIYTQVKEHGDIWPLNDWYLQKIGNKNQITQTNTEYASQFTAAYETYAVQPDAEKLVALLRTFPRISRAYIAAVAEYIKPFMQKKKDPWKEPLWKDAYERLQQHSDAVRLSEIDETIVSSLIKAYHKMQSYAHQSQHTIILGHETFLRTMARTCSRSLSWDFEDAFQEAHIGLMNATQKYDHLYGFKFETYARWWVHAQMFLAYNERELPICRRRSLGEEIIEIKKVIMALAEELQRGPTLLESANRIHADLGISLQRFVAIEQTHPHRFSSLDEKPTGYPFTYYDTIPDTALPLDDMTHMYREIQKLLTALSELPLSERDIIRQRWLGDEVIPSRELGDIMGVSCMAILRREKKGFDNIRKSLCPQQRVEPSPVHSSASVPPRMLRNNSYFGRVIPND